MIKSFKVLLILFIVLPGYLLAQAPRVPSEIEFADIKLRITDGARKEIQTHVDALYRSEKYFKIKLDRVDLYFPIIERIFIEEGLPVDFKYLVIQESALISDAVSSSNAVGFWQFKEASGEEVGLRIDGAVDERLNIVSATRGAARYLKRNNNYFDNWLYALLSYNMGAGGAQQVVEEKYFGAKRMEINKRTHWYIMKFLAHKVAFENAIGKNLTPELALVEYTSGANKSLSEVANEVDVDSQLLEDYNKWLKRGKVPDDKVYAVIVPVAPSAQSNVLANMEEKEHLQLQNTSTVNTNPSFNNRFSKGSDKYPVIEGGAPMSDKESVLVTVNGKPGIIAGVDDNLLSLAKKGDVSISRFLRYNDLNSSDKAVAGQVYYLKSKRGRAPEHYHVVLETENMWSISQKYGIKLKKLLHKNRMEPDEQAKPGRVLWMRFVRPSDEPIEYKETVNAEELAINETVKTAVGDENKEEDSLLEYTDVKSEDQGEIVTTTTEEEHVVQEIAEQEVATAEVPQEVYREAPLEEEGSFNTEDVQFVNTATSGKTAADAEDNGTHVIKQGETLYGIARQYGVQLGDLLYWNNLSLKDGIKTGQLLKVTSPKEEPVPTISESSKDEDQFIIHEVSSGETMYKIARDHNVTIKDVMLWNDKEDFKVSIGERLRIKKVEE